MIDTITIIIMGSTSTIISLLVTIGYIKGRLDGVERRIQAMQEQINLIFNKMINSKHGDSS